MRKLSLAISSGTILSFFTVSTVLADNCSSPGDCMQTAGYNATIAIVGSVIGLAATLFGSQLAELIRNSVMNTIKDISDNKLTDVFASNAEAAMGIPVLPPPTRLPFLSMPISLEQPPDDPGGPSPGQRPTVDLSTSTVTDSTSTIINLEPGDQAPEQQGFDIDRVMNVEIERLRKNVGMLADRARQAAIAHSTDCADSVAQVANEYDITDLNGLRANAQVQQMIDAGWTTVSAEKAQRIANHGELVIAGRANPDGHGHVAVVVPGEMVLSGDRNYYPLVAGGAIDEAHPNTPGAAYSAEGHGANFAWQPPDRKGIHYYVAPTPNE